MIHRLAMVKEIPRPDKIVRRWGHLSTVLIIHEFRNQGVGGELMETIREWCREQDFEEMD